MTIEATAQSQFSDRKSRRTQFRLGTLLLVIAVIAIAFAWWFYYRSLDLTLDVRFAIVDAAAANTMLSSHAPNSVDNSPLVWVELDDRELSSLLIRDDKITAMAGMSYPQPVAGWPTGAALARVYTQSRSIHIAGTPSYDLTRYETGQFGGVAGCRRAGMVPQFRVEGELSCQQPDLKAISANSPTIKPEKMRLEKARLFYEGALPEGHLVFLVPMGDDLFHVAIFDLK